MPDVPYNNYWKVFQNQPSVRQLLGAVGTNPSNTTWTFNYSSGYMGYFRLGINQGTYGQPQDCINNSQSYILMWDDTHFMDVDINSSIPTFRVQTLSDSVPVTYFKLRDPRKAVANTFLVTRDGSDRFITINMFFTNENGSANDPSKDITFKCSSCSCGSNLNCLADGNCANPTCSGTVCEGVCSGTCPSGKTCQQKQDGTYECVYPCSAGICGGNCYGSCSTSGQYCLEQTSGEYFCGVPTENNLCGGTNKGTCPAGKECVTSGSVPTGTYSCQTACSGKCGGRCQGTCDEGSECFQGQDGNWACLEVEEKNPWWKSWWFILIMIVIGAALVIVIVFVIVKVVKKKKDDGGGDSKDKSFQQKTRDLPMEMKKLPDAIKNVTK
jgi:hypothetical protein